MPLIINGVTIPDNGEVYVNGAKPASIKVNGVEVWRMSDSVTINYLLSECGGAVETLAGDNGVFTFTPPVGVTTITVSGIGAGGSGGVTAYDSLHISGGGHAGTENCGMAVAASPTHSIVIGAGGAVVSRGSEGGTNGNAGANSSIEGYIYAGGVGGVAGALDYNGVGAEHTDCLGNTHLDGADTDGASLGRGGQAGWGDGGCGIHIDGDGVGVACDGGIGSGGGAADLGTDSGGWNVTSGAGGNGQIIISW